MLQMIIFVTTILPLSMMMTMIIMEKGHDMEDGIDNKDTNGPSN